MNVEQIHIEFVAADGATMPEKAHANDAAFDLRAYLSAGLIYLHAGQTALVPTGLKVALPAGVAAFVLPRSGLALKHGITVLNSPGLIDPGYRGEVGVILHNASNHVFTIRHGDRIAQLLPFRLTPASFWHHEGVYPSPFDAGLRGEGLESGERGEGGFGSTGL